MDLTDIHMEMKNDCGDLQERLAMEEVELDPLRNPLPQGSNAWEEDFMETMRKAQKYGWKLSDKQIRTLDRIRDQYEEIEEQYEEDERDRYQREEEEATAHMTKEEQDRFYEYMEEVNHRDVQSGSYGSVRAFRGPCPTWYDSSGYSNGRGYQGYGPRY